jgi:hypothetical protein
MSSVVIGEHAIVGAGQRGHPRCARQRHRGRQSARVLRFFAPALESR